MSMLYCPCLRAWCSCDFPAVGWVDDGYRYIFLRPHLQLGYSTAIVMGVGWHSLASPVCYCPCRLLGEMPIWVLLFKRLWVCYHCWLERVGCVLGTNSVIRHDLADILSHSIRCLLSWVFLNSYMYYFLYVCAWFHRGQLVGVSLSSLWIWGTELSIRFANQRPYPLSHLLGPSFKLWHY